MLAHRPPLAHPNALFVWHHTQTKGLFCNLEFFLEAQFSRKTLVNTVFSRGPSFAMTQMNVCTSHVILMGMVRI